MNTTQLEVEIRPEKKIYFVSQCQYNIQESSDKNKENHY